MSVAATLSDHLVEAVPGEESAITVRVLNDGDLVDEIDVDVVGEPREWARVVPGRLFLLPGESGVARVVFRPPRSPSVRAGVRRFGVRVRSREDPSASAVEEGTAIVAPYDDVEVVVRPRLRHGRGRVGYAVEVDNAGNAPADVRLDAVDDEEALRYAFSAPVVTVEPGMRAGVRLGVRPRRRLLSGAPRARAFSVRAWHAAEEPAAAGGAYVQRPLVAPWAIRAAVLVVLVGGLLFALALSRGYPQRVETLARVSNANEEQAAGDARTAQRAAAAAQQQAAAAAAKLAQAEEKLASPGPGPLTTPYGVSLPIPAPSVDGQTGVGRFTWEGAPSLALTDLLVTNRAGDTVAVRVLRDGAVLFQLYADSPEPRALAFATPVRFPASGTLTVEVTCVATSAPRCEPVVYAGGFLA